MKKNRVLTRIIFMVAICFLGNLNKLSAQTVTHQQYLVSYLEIMAQKGFIDFNDLIKPVDRKQVFTLLQSLQNNPKLNSVEKQELAFFINGFKLEDSTYMPNSKVAPSFKHFFKKPKDEQYLFLYKDQNFGFILDPMLQINEQVVNGNSVSAQALGFQLMGYAGKRIGFQMSYQDINERGRFDATRMDNDLPGIVRKQTTDPRLLNYSQMNATLSYRLNKGNIIVGQDQNIYGYGKSGNMVLSDKAPAYPFFAINYQPTSWFKFNYMHAWLQSGVVDSTASYGIGNSVYGGMREKFIPKFYASHSVEFTVMKGLKINVGESIVYSDKVELAYLLPITFFKAFDNQKFNDNILAGSNGQLFMGFSSRNQLPRTHLYGQLFIDEIRIGTIFNSGQSRNQVGFQTGVSIADFLFPNLTAAAEYSRINPFVYRNFIPAQNYTNSNYALGDWMGNNADRIWLSAKYRPKANLVLTGYMMLMSKGGAGTVEQQYFAQPQPSFGFDPQYKRNKLGLEASYSLWNNVQFRMAFANTYQRPNNGPRKTLPEASLGVYWNKF
jgi:hypothetical protein